jgi:hypothetical protein
LGKKTVEVLFSKISKSGRKPYDRLVIVIPKASCERFRKFVGKVCRITVEVLE